VSGIKASFSPATLTTGGTSTMTITISAGVASGAVPVTVTAKGGGVTASTRVTLNVTSIQPGSGAIGINFIGAGTSVPAATLAGVVPRANWNNVSGMKRTTPVALVDETGTASGAKVVWSAFRTWQTSITSTDGNSLLMRGYLDTTSSSTTTVTVSSLPVRAYDVYVYVDGDNASATRSATYALTPVGGPTQSVAVTDAKVDFGGTFIDGRNRAGNYVKFSITGSGFTLKATPSTSSNSTRRAPVNAIQIVPAEPAPPAGTISVDFVGTSTKALGAGDTAGVVAVGGWNSAAGSARSSALALIDDSGAASGASATWSSANTWTLPIAIDTPDKVMMAGYLDTPNGTHSTVTIAGLAEATYEVYVYIDGDNRSYTRSADYALTVPSGAKTTIRVVDQASTNFSGRFRQASGTAGNYIVFTMTGTGFTLTATPVSGTNATLRAPINALQIVPRPLGAP
jgi:hypothetical protein